jgi:AsmA protein
LTAAIGLKRLAIAVAAILAAAFITLVALSILIPAASVRDAVQSEIRAVTGLDPMLGDDISLSLFPSGAVTFHKVMLGDNRSTEPAVTADELTARLRYFPLLAGRIEIADVTLLHPTINVTFAANGVSNWAGFVDSLAHALAPNADHHAASFSEIDIQDGTVVVHDVAKNATEQLENVAFQVAWPSISRSFGANGRFVWNDQPVEASLTLSDFFAALTGDRSGLKLRISGAPLQVAFDGWASAEPTLKIEGALGVDAPSLRDALRWTGSSKLPFGGFGRFTLRAQSDIGGGIAALSNVNVEVDGNAAEGALSLSTDGHHLVQGTLAADALDLTPYLSGVRLLARNERNWDVLPIRLDGFGDLNLDLRLSAASIKLGSAQLGRTAVAANMHNGKLDLTVGEAQAFGGTIKGTLGFNAAESGISVASHMQFADVDLNDCLGQIFALRKLTGRGNVAINVEGSGASVMGVTHTLNGTASLTARSGALSGMNIEQLLRRLQRRPLSGSGDFRSGSTPFDEIAVNLKIDRGTVVVEDMHIDGPAVKLAVGGQASVPTRDLDLKGVATLVATANADEFDLPFVVQGPWDDPIMLPDAQALIRRSGAAAPLLDAAKTHNASDAVRAVIDQLLTSPSGAPQAQGVSPASTTVPAPVPAKPTQ